MRGLDVPDKPNPSATDVLSTLVVVTREAYIRAVASLESMLSSIPDNQPVVIVHGASPDDVREQLRAIADNRPVTLVSANRFLTPNQARNIGRRFATTKYTVFVDNDVVVEPGWLENLERCAEETGASMVAPLCLVAVGAHESVHMAGGFNRIERQPDGRVIHVEHHHHAGAARSEVEALLRREQTELIEFHCALIRNDVLDQVGPLDEGLRSLHEHCDVSLAVTRAGGAIWFEPTAVVTYAPPDHVSRTDAAYWFWRWSDAWNNASVDHFARKWGVSNKRGSLLAATRYGRYQRRRTVPWPRIGAKRRAGRRRIAFRCWARVWETAGLATTISHRWGEMRIEVWERTRSQPSVAAAHRMRPTAASRAGEA